MCFLIILLGFLFLFVCLLAHLLTYLLWLSGSLALSGTYYVD